MSARFTPGPWVAEASEKSASVSIYGKRGDGNVRRSDGLGLIVTVDCALEPDAVMLSPINEEDSYNAALIRAAPELYEMLTIALGVIGKAGVIWLGEDRALTILRKARGEP